MPIHGYPGNIITANPTAPTNTTASGVWTLEQQLQAQAAGNWPMAATQISRSLRFNSADSAYLNRTPASASNRKTYTFSLWAKRSTLSTRQNFFSVNSPSSGNNGFSFEWLDTNSIGVYFDDGVVSPTYIGTTPVYRDPSSWYHIVLAVDATQATSGDRVKIYVNGVSVAYSFLFGSAAITNVNTLVNSTSQHNIGVSQRGTSTLDQYLNGYITEINFIDGQALTPNSFGFFDNNGVWAPKQYTGPYGTNGFFLNFSDNSNTTATTLGKDYSGNGNNWTPNNFSVAAGAGNDSLVDSPTRYGTDTGAGGEVRGNYNTWNPLLPTGATFVNGNLDVTTSSGHSTPRGTLGVSSGKWYWEITPTSITSNQLLIGIINTDNTAVSGTFNPSGSYAYYSFNGNKYTGGGTNSAYGNTFTNNDVIGVALDLDNNYLYFSKNGTFQNSGVPTSGSSGTGGISIAANTYSCWVDDGSGSGTSTLTSNFGQRPFAYTAPSGFKALVTTNLPEPTVADGGEYFNTVLYTGTGSARSVTGVGFQPDWVWYKERSSTSGNLLFDVLRGVNNLLVTNNTDAEQANAQTLTSFDSDGFSVGDNAASNESGQTYVAWNWKANGAGVTNTAGTITSTVSVNTTSGFSIATFTAPVSGTCTVGHGLGVAPEFFFIKSRANAFGWTTYHKSVGNTAYLVLNSTAASATDANTWNNTSPTSTVFTLGQNFQNTSTWVAYCFAPVAGYSAFGSYTGNGSTDGPFVYLGFRPRYVLVKNANDVQNWFILDTARSTFNLSQALMRPNTSDAEATGFGIDIISNGFKVRNNDPSYNANGNTIIYACFAENPFKLALAR